jgi:hypothetical protein
MMADRRTGHPTITFNHSMSRIVKRNMGDVSYSTSADDKRGANEFVLARPFCLVREAALRKRDWTYGALFFGTLTVPHAGKSSEFRWLDKTVLGGLDNGRGHISGLGRN